MSGFSKLLAEEYERCLTPASSPTSVTGFDYSECCSYKRDDAAQPTITASQSAVEQKTVSGSTQTVTKRGNMTADEVVARIDRDMAKDALEARIAYLVKRRAEIHDIMATEKELHKEWRVKVKEKFEEVEQMKETILANMKREDKMTIVKADFILRLMSVNFEHELEDVYGSGKKIFRSFKEV